MKINNLQDFEQFLNVHVKPSIPICYQKRKEVQSTLIFDLIACGHGVISFTFEDRNFLCLMTRLIVTLSLVVRNCKGLNDEVTDFANWVVQNNYFVHLSKQITF